jgi:CRISPR-associated endonuclease/helicase Cas3
MDRALAHIGGATGQPHLLIEHLHDVAKKAQEMAGLIRGDDVTFVSMAKWSAWVHDLGKYRDEFQEYLRGRRSKSSETQHAIFGATWALYNELPRAVALTVLGHHAGLHDWSTAQSRIAPDEFGQISQGPILMDRLRSDLPDVGADLPEMCTEYIVKRRGGLLTEPRDELLVRMLFSCLVDADYLDTEAYVLGHPRTPVGLTAGELFEKVRTHVAGLRSKSPDNEVNRVRESLFRACVESAENQPGFFSVTAPTGSGKTLAMMGFALRHAEKHGLRRVIVVLPYVSIIEQNAAIYRKVLGQGFVVEHHSAAEPGSPARQSPGATSGEGPTVAEEEATDQGAGVDRARLAARLATENWDAPIIVTTAVQFLESLFARKPSRCRKLHNIGRSVVIFDEVQSLPLNLLEPILSMLRDLKGEFGCSFLFGSATQPRFGRHATDLPSGFAAGECSEIAPDPRRTFGILRRTRFDLAFRDGGPWTRGFLLDRITAEPRVLVVVNFRKQAQELYSKLKEQGTDGLFHLSSTMCAAHRRAILGKRDNPERGTIYHALMKTKGPCRVVSTQVVEAGVDISFPVVFRHIAPLDGILQAAGRCNREGELPVDPSGRPGGRVVIFEIADEPHGPRGFYREAATQARSRLVNWAANPDDLTADPSVFGAYHDNLIRWRDTDQKKIQDLRRRLCFEAVAKAFKVIDEAGTAVIVPFGEAPSIVARVRKRGVMTYEDRRLLQHYTVNLFPNWISSLGADLQPFMPADETLLCHPARYHEALGVNLGELPIETFAFFDEETA